MDKSLLNSKIGKKKWVLPMILAFLLASCDQTSGLSSGDESTPEEPGSSGVTASESVPGSSESQGSDINQGGSSGQGNTGGESVTSVSKLVFGTGMNATIGDPTGEGSYLIEGNDIFDSATFSNCFSPANGAGSYAFRLGSSSKGGTASVYFDGTYDLVSVDVTCLKYGSDDSQFTGTAMGNTFSQDVAVDWSEAQTVTFSVAASSTGFTLSNTSDHQRVYVQEIAFTILVDGDMPDVPGPGSSSSSGDQPNVGGDDTSSSSSSLTTPPSVVTGDLAEEYQALSSSVRNYYSSVNLNTTGATLKSEFSDVIRSSLHVVGYNSLMNVYRDADVDENGYIVDIYSTGYHYRPSDGFCGNYSGEGDGFNREHLIPQSVFSERSPMKSDAMHVVPTDGYNNGRRGNHPFGEVANATYTTNNGCKLGSNTYPGYSGTCWEVADEYKGDIARTYFYFVTCYEDESMNNYSMFSRTNSKLTLSTWARNMLLEWAAEDPVSEREIARNQAVYNHQDNRNPYIDFPSLANIVFGAQ